MKIRSFLSLTGLLAGLAQPGAANMSVTFDTSAFTDTSGLYVTFAGQESDMVYDPGGVAETINFNANSISIGGTSYGTSKAYKLDDINANGLTLNSSTSLLGFVSYGGTTGIAQLGTGVQPDPLSSATSRYSNFEVTYDGSGGGADITNITAFGGSIKLSFLNGSTVQSYVGNTLNTGDMFREFVKTTNRGLSSSAIYTDGGEFLRAIGPNKFPASIDGSLEQVPYPTFNGYLNNLYTGSNAGADDLGTKMTNLAPTASPGGMGSAGFNSTGTATEVTPNTGYNLDYHFQAKVVEVAAPGSASAPDGTYQVVLSGYVNATPQGGGTTVKYDNLSITINADDPGNDDLFMTNFLYQETIEGPNVSVVLNGWGALENDFGAATTESALQLKAAGDFTQAMLAGFVGSTVQIDMNGIMTNLGDLTTYELWENAVLLAYAPARAGMGDEFYSLWGEVVAANSEALKDGTTYSRLGVYGSPYDDRFDINLISPDANTTEMRITLLADGNLSIIPEPGTFALGAGFLAGTLALLRRKR